MTPVYPHELEAWWLAQARSVTGAANNGVALAALEPVVAQLSDGFTKERAAGFGGYASDARALAAYGLFYFPQTFVRTLFQADEIEQRCGWRRPADRPLRMIDLGAGAGSAGLALASRWARGGAVELTALETAPESLDLAVRLAAERKALWPGLTLQARGGSLLDFPGADDRGYDVIIASFSLNECFHSREEAEIDAWIDRAVAALAEGGLLLISEPATPSHFARLLRFRERMAGRLEVLAPCLHAQPCPLRAARGDAFCHEVRWWKPPASLQSLNSKLFRTAHYLKFGFLAAARRAAAVQPGSAELARLVSPLVELKGRVQCDGCAADGALRRYELLTRGLKGAAKKDFLATARGDVVRWADVTQLGDGTTYRATSAVREFPPALTPET